MKNELQVNFYVAPDILDCMIKRSSTSQLTPGKNEILASSILHKNLW